MHRMAAGSLLILLAAVPARGQGIESNARPYVLGGRAGGMGGAFTALADDGSAGYYNPGGLAFARASSISFSVNVLGLTGGSVKDALGDGHDFTYRDLQIFPVATAGIEKLGDVDPATGVPAHTLFFSIFVPDGVSTDDRDQLGDGRNAYFSRRSNQTLWIGGGYAVRLGQVGLGVAAYGLVGRTSNFLDLDVIDDTGSQFVIISARDDLSTYGVVLSAGARWDPTDRLHLGVSLFTPEWGGGSRTSFVRVGAAVTGGSGARGSQDDSLSATPSLPLRLQAGVAWDVGRWTLAGDLMLLGPRHVRDDPGRAAEGLDREIIRRTVVNVAAGAEVRLGGGFALRAGAFTDFAASDSTSLRVDNTSHVHRTGLTVSIGLRGEHVRTDLGLMGWYGTGTDVVPRNLDFTDLRRTDVTEYGVYGALATSYEF